MSEARLLLLVPLLLACAPARLAADGGTTTSQSNTDSSTSEERESGSEGEDSSDSSTGRDFLPSFDLGGPEPCDSFAQDCPEGSADDPQCPDPIGCRSYGCSISGDSSVYLCLLSCDPLAQDCGHESLACYWTNSWFYCLGTTAEQPIGEPCSASTDCVAGSTCVPAELLPSCAGDFCCTPFCDPTAIVDTCPELLAGTSCVVFEEASEDLPSCSIGRCLAPP